MKDIHGIQLRLRERQTITTLKRVVPGDYSSVEEITNPTLEYYGFNLNSAKIVHMAENTSFFTVFRSDTVAESRQPVSDIIKQNGDWCLIHDGKDVTSAGSLWLAVLTDSPDQLLKNLKQVRMADGVFLRPIKAGWIFAVRALFLKHLLKNANHNRL